MVMDKVKWLDNDDAFASGSDSISNYSDLSAMENETDELGRRILQHQRNSRRLYHDSHNKNFASHRRSDAFSKLEALTRAKRTYEVQESRQTYRPRRDSSGSESPQRVTQQWGSKGRTSSSWMRRIQEPDDFNKDDGREQPAPNVRYSRKVDSIYDERSRIEDGADDEIHVQTSRYKHNLFAKSASLRRTTTIEKENEPDDREFTDVDILASTPAPRRLPRKIDQLVPRETQDVEQRKAMGRTRDRIAESNNDPTARRYPSTGLGEDGVNGARIRRSYLDRPTSAEGNMSIASRIPRWMRSPIRNKENHPPEEEGSDHQQKDGLATAPFPRVEQAAVDSKVVYRPRTHDGDSMTLLKKLARVSSMSPSPARPHTSASESGIKADQKGEALVPVVDTQLDGASTHAAVTGPRSGKPILDARFESRDRPRVQFERKVDIPDPTEDAPTIDTNPEAMPTPVATGAWIDTMIEDVEDVEDNESPSPSPKKATRKMNTEAPSSAKETTASKDVEHDKTRKPRLPRLPRSALEELVNAAKQEDTSQRLGESTILSLENIVHPPIPMTDPTITFDLDALKKEILEECEPRPPPAGGDRRQEQLTTEVTNKHITTSRKGTKDADQGLAEAISNVKPAIDKPKQTELSTLVVTKATTPSTVQSTVPAYCARCAHEIHGTSLWMALFYEFLSLFYIWNPQATSSNKRPWHRAHLTTLGFVILLAFTWFVAETIFCINYCHPLYAASMIDYGVDPDAPDFPFVIPTLALRPFKWLWEPALEVFIAASTVLFNAIFGTAARGTDPAMGSGRIRYGGGFPPYGSIPGTIYGGGEGWHTVHATPKWLSTAAQVTTRVVGSVVDAVDQVGRMWDDEAI